MLPRDKIRRLVHSINHSVTMPLSMNNLSLDIYLVFLFIGMFVVISNDTNYYKISKDYFGPNT